MANFQENINTISDASFGYQVREAIVAALTELKSNSTPNTQNLVGSVVAYAGRTIPAGYLLCDGRSVSRTEYSALFSAIGGAYYQAGTPETEFRLPDMRGRTAVGHDPSQPQFDAVGKKGGAVNHTLTLNELPSHNHGMHGNVFKWGPNLGGISVPGANAVSGVTTSGNPLYTNMNSYGWADTLTAGGGQAHNNLQPYITINYIIKY